jgi:hypothetical protein
MSLAQFASHRHVARFTLLLAAVLLLAGCSGDGAAPRPAQPAPPPVELRRGDLRISASITPTRQLDAAVARGYGIPRTDDGVLVLVTVREGPDGAETALASDVTGWASDLQGRRHALAFRELRAAGYVDQAAVLDVRAPDTLQFHLAVTPRGRASQQLDFVREFHPR